MDVLPCSLGTDALCGEPVPEQPPPYWRCGCGAFEVTLTRAPRFCMDCACQSCGAVAAYAAAADPRSTSALSAHGTVRKAFFFCGDCTLPEDSAGRLYGVDVDGGANRRLATACCHTLFATGWLSLPLRPLNRACLYTFDGARWEPDDAVCTGNRSHAADPRAVPEPSAPGAPPGGLALGLQAMCFAPEIDDEVRRFPRFFFTARRLFSRRPQGWTAPAAAARVSLPKTW